LAVSAAPLPPGIAKTSMTAGHSIFISPAARNPVSIRQIPIQYAKSTDQRAINQTKRRTLVIDSNQIARAHCGNDA